MKTPFCVNFVANARLHVFAVCVLACVGGLIAKRTRYTHNPSLLWWLVYLGYWALVIAVLSYRSYKGTLYSKNGLSPVLEDGLGDDDDVESGVGSQSSSIPKVSPNPCVSL